MTRPQKRDSLAAYAVAAAIGIAALIIVSLIGMSHADAGGFRSRAVCAPHVIHQQAVPVAAIPYPVIGYQVAQHLQQAAVDEYGFRASPSQQRLTFLEGYFQAQQERLTDSGDRPTGPHQPPSEGHDATDGGQTTCPDCVKPEEPQAFSAPAKPQRFLESTGEPLYGDSHESFSESHPKLSAACTACHVDEQSKGGFGIAKAVVEAQSTADCETILAMVDSIATGSMPKGKPLSDADRLAAIAELLGK